jgi:hypothetical protein
MMAKTRRPDEHFFSETFNRLQLKYLANKSSSNKDVVIYSAAFIIISSEARIIYMDT